MAPSYGFTDRYLTKNDEPWFPVMGEIHYSRVMEGEWEDALLKMKAGGVTLASAYVIWIHHEEEEGRYDFSGNKNLRKFIETADSCGMRIALRIGPWSHGEVRNGGFPDWLLKKAAENGFTPRANDGGYLAEVEKLYRAVYSEVEGLLFNPETGSGPVIAVQIENEYGHCGGLTGEEGERHMRALTDMAKRAGFSVPLYTATGWGGAVTGGLVPVMGGYCESPWDQRLTEIEPSGNYIFTHERNDHNIGSDFGFGAGITFDISRFPYLTAELGGGLQITRHRRPVAYASDIGAMSLVKLGSGVNLLGYYMYHGGTNPEGKFSTLQETRETGSPNDLPELSYDFRAPIREYGQISPTFRELKLLTLFLRDFGSDLCGLPAEIPAANPLKPEDTEGLRHAFRCADGRGYVFVSAYQRRKTLASHHNVKLKTPGTGVELPEFDIENGEYFFMPFCMELKADDPASDGNGATLAHAHSAPLCILHTGADGKKPVYVFYARRGEPAVREGSFTFKGGCAIPVLPLTRAEALDAWPVRTGDGERLLITAGSLIETKHAFRYKLFTRHPCGVPHSEPEDEAFSAGFTAYPPLVSTPAGFTLAACIKPQPAATGVPVPEGRIFVRSAGCAKDAGVSGGGARKTAAGISAHATFAPGEKPEPRRDHSADAYSSGVPFVYKISVTGLPDSLPATAGTDGGSSTERNAAGVPSLSDIFLHIEYEGESARLYHDGKLVADNLYCGKLRHENGAPTCFRSDNPVWEVSLKNIGSVSGAKTISALRDLKLEVFPLAEDAPIFIETKPVFQNGSAGKLLGVSVEAEFETEIDLT